MQFDYISGRWLFLYLASSLIYVARLAPVGIWVSDPCPRTVESGGGREGGKLGTVLNSSLGDSHTNETWSSRHWESDKGKVGEVSQAVWVAGVSENSDGFTDQAGDGNVWSGRV